MGEGPLFIDAARCWSSRSPCLRQKVAWYMLKPWPRDPMSLACLAWVADTRIRQGKCLLSSHIHTGE